VKQRAIDARPSRYSRTIHAVYRSFGSPRRVPSQGNTFTIRPALGRRLHAPHEEAGARHRLFFVRHLAAQRSFSWQAACTLRGSRASLSSRARTQPVAAHRHIDRLPLPLWWLRTLSIAEHPDSFCALIDLLRRTPTSQSAAHHKAFSTPTAKNQVAFRKRTSVMGTRGSLPSPSQPPAADFPTGDATYLMYRWRRRTRPDCCRGGGGVGVGGGLDDRALSRLQPGSSCGVALAATPASAAESNHVQVPI